MPRKSTRGAKGAGTIRQRPDGRWEARFTVGYDPATGRQKQRSLYAATQKEAAQRMREALSALDNGSYREPLKLTVGEWLHVWLRDYTSELKPRALESYEGYVRNYLAPYLGNVRLQKLTAPQIQAMLGKLQREGGVSGRSLSAKTIKNLHGCFHTALKQAVEVGYISKNPIEACKLPKVQRREIHALEEGDLARFLEAIQTSPYHNLFLVDLFTGMRQSEILGLTWDCVDLEGGSVHVGKQLQKIKGVYSFQPTKNGKARDIPLASTVREALAAQRRAQAQWKLLAGPAWDNGLNLVFTNRLGGHLCHNTIAEHFKKLLTGLGLPATRFHDLRHAYVVSQIQAGVDIKTIQHNAGHYSAAFTLDQYGHITARMRNESAEKLQGYIDRLQPAREP